MTLRADSKWKWLRNATIRSSRVAPFLRGVSRDATRVAPTRPSLPATGHFPAVPSIRRPKRRLLGTNGVIERGTFGLVSSLIPARRQRIVYARVTNSVSNVQTAQISPRRKTSPHHVPRRTPRDLRHLGHGGHTAEPAGDREAGAYQLSLGTGRRDRTPQRQAIGRHDADRVSGSTTWDQHH